jgi:disulfide bond formation protein DsbB
MAASTVPASVDGAHAAPPAALSEAAGSLAAGALAAGTLAAGLAVVPPLQAATISIEADVKASKILLDMWASSWFQARASCGGYADGYVGVGWAVS